ncbi:MAG: adenylosuccinate lyase family protein [Rhodobacterales bacterium]|nr:adenylosuccinate lyase family protein [Rhodobacterales bacterium]
MPLSPADHAVHAALFADPATQALFAEAAELQAMQQVEAALAQAQADLGLIPAEAAAAIARAARTVTLDPGALAAESARNGVPVPGFVSAFRAAMDDPQAAAFVHWGATSQDIMDTALVLRLRILLDDWGARLDALLIDLARLAADGAEIPMAARTYGQIATPTSFGAVVAGWGRPVARQRARLAALRDEVLVVQLGGAAGTLSAMDGQGPAVRAGMARRLGLGDPGQVWHAERDRIALFGAWAAQLAVALGKMGEDLILMTQTGLAEVILPETGGSSTMPQKRNPVAPSVLVALARQAVGLQGVLQGAGLHRQARDGAAWFTEWLALPGLCGAAGRALGLAQGLAAGMAPDPEAMARGLAADNGLILAEGLSFALARHLPRPQAQAQVKALCDRARRAGRALPDLAAEAFPDLDLTGAVARAALGTAPDEARAFAAAVRAGAGTGG